MELFSIRIQRTFQLVSTSIGYFDNYFAYTCMDNVITAQIAYAISYVKFSIYIHTCSVLRKLFFNF